MQIQDMIISGIIAREWEILRILLITQEIVDELLRILSLGGVFR